MDSSKISIISNKELRRLISALEELPDCFKNSSGEFLPTDSLEACVNSNLGKKGVVEITPKVGVSCDSLYLPAKGPIVEHSIILEHKGETYYLSTKSPRSMCGISYD